MSRRFHFSVFQSLSFDGANHPAAGARSDTDKVKAASFGFEGMYAGGGLRTHLRVKQKG